MLSPVAGGVVPPVDGGVLSPVAGGVVPPVDGGVAPPVAGGVLPPGAASTYVRPAVSTDEVPSGAKTNTSYSPATRATVRKDTLVGVTETTSAAPVAPIRTRAPAGMASPVMVTRVPPAVLTRVGSMEVSRNGPTCG